MKKRRTKITLLFSAVALVGAATVLLAPGASALGAPIDVVVTTTDDYSGFALDGSCDGGPDGTCSLREAVMEADTNLSGGNVTFGIDGTFTVRGNIPVYGEGGGQVVVTGNGVDETVLVAESPIRNFRGIAESRHFDVLGGDLLLERMTLRDGRAALGGSVAVRDGGSLSTQDVHFLDNSAELGGAIVADARDETVEIDRTTFAGNAAVYGGAIYVNDDTADVVNSTFTANTAEYGAAVYVVSLGTVTIDHSTFSQNIVGPGVRPTSSSATPFQSFRAAPAVPAGIQQLAGLIVGEQYEVNVADVTVSNSILEKTTGDTTDECLGPIASGGGNVVDDDSCDFTEPLDQQSTLADVGDLGANGGETFTMALVAASPAVDVDPSACSITDQRALPRNTDGDGDGTAGCDAGAYELQEATTSTTATPTTQPDGDVDADADTATPATPTVARPTFTG